MTEGHQYPHQQQHPAHPQQTAQVPPPQGGGKGLGITSLVLGIVALVLAFIPVIGLFSFLLGFAAAILGILAIVKRNGKGQGIAGLITGVISFGVAGAVTLFTGAVFSAMDDELQDTSAEPEEAAEAPKEDEDQIDEAEEAAEEAAEAAEDVDESEVEEADGSDASGDAGSRENPLNPGESIVSDEWELTINDVTFDADDAVAAENQFNDPADEGDSYILINVEATYTGDDSGIPATDTEVAWVTESGETVQAFDTLAVAPDEFDSMTELYNGGSEAGNIAIAVPSDYDGLIRARLGLFDVEEAFFSAE